MGRHREKTQSHLRCATPSRPGWDWRNRTPADAWGRAERKAGVRQAAWPTHWTQQRGWGRWLPMARSRSPLRIGSVPSGDRRSRARSLGSPGASMANWHRKAVPSGHAGASLALRDAK